MRVRELLDVPDLGLRLLTDVAGMNRAILRVYTTDLPDPSRYLTPGDLVLTGLMWCRAPGDADRFVSALIRAGVSALGAGEALGAVPDEVVRRADQIDYYYASRLAGEPLAGGNDVHFHPVEPLAVRFTVSKAF